MNAADLVSSAVGAWANLLGAFAAVVVAVWADASVKRRDVQTRRHKAWEEGRQLIDAFDGDGACESAGAASERLRQSLGQVYQRALHDITQGVSGLVGLPLTCAAEAVDMANALKGTSVSHLMPSTQTLLSQTQKLSRLEEVIRSLLTLEADEKRHVELERGLRPTIWVSMAIVLLTPTAYGFVLYGETYWAAFALVAQLLAMVTALATFVLVMTNELPPRRRDFVYVLGFLVVLVGAAFVVWLARGRLS